MSGPIHGLEPAALWSHFAALCRIPHCSGQEAAARQYVVDTARRLGLSERQDPCGNVVVRKPASPGRAGGRPVCLQAHLDMVCEKAAGVDHDFGRDPIALARRDRWIHANGTTLGADNGIGVAANLALMEMPDAEHGPLEFLFTVQEETGHVGAAGLSPDALESRTLINLDGEEDGTACIGAAGGTNTTATWPIDTDVAPAGTVPVRIVVNGLQGGHSGLEIDKGRGNAIKILGRVLHTFQETAIEIATLSGGTARNTIPRRAEAVALVASNRLAEIEGLVGEWDRLIRSELAGTDPEAAVSIGRLNHRRRWKVLRPALRRRLTVALIALPHGVARMSADIPGLPQTSSNLAVLSSDDEVISMTISHRASLESELDEAVERTAAILAQAGGTVSHWGRYPAWTPNLQSPVLTLARQTYCALYGRELQLKAIHAGLECGNIQERFPDMDIISFGPQMINVHTPEEAVEADSVERFWTFLLAMLCGFR
jgi:dipeptidase D